MRLCTLRMLCVAGAARCQQPCTWVISFQTTCPPTKPLLPFHLLPHSYYFFLLQSNYQSPSDHPFFSASQHRILPVFCYLIPTQPIAKKCCENQAHTWGRVYFPDYSSQISLPSLFHHPVILYQSVLYCLHSTYNNILLFYPFVRLFVVCPFHENASSMRTKASSPYTFGFSVFNTWFVLSKCLLSE